MSIKDILLTIIGAIGGFISWLYGGWSTAMITLIIFMAVDYLTGLIVAGVFKNSRKTENGALDSRAGFKGLCKKGAILLVVLVAAQLDRLTDSHFIRDAVVVAFVANEGLSILENVGDMGISVPEIAKKVLNMLKKKGEEEKPPDEG